MNSLVNTWMNNTYFLATSAHIFFGLSTVETAFLGWGTRGEYIACGSLIFMAAVKEFWYDAAFELPKQTLIDNIIDFTGYMVGIGLGVLLIKLFR